MKKEIAALAILVGIATSGYCNAQSKKTVGHPVPASEQVSMDKIDHCAWHQLLQKFVDEQGQVNYKAWKESAEASATLDTYLKTLSTASRTIQADHNSQLAFWINAYNAVTIQGILQVYPTTSIRKHTSRIGGYNIWKHLLLAVGDTKISLNDIEHEVLRKMSEPRIHFAIVCASHSCPRLLNQAYTAEKLEQQLTTNTKAFFANRENFQFDTSRNRFQMSEILSWFATDFGADQAAQLRTFAPYLPTQAAHDAAQRNSVSVSYLNYDWNLNEVRADRQSDGGRSRR